MTGGGAFDDIIAAATRHHASFAKGGLARVPSKGLALVTCMDSRIDTFSIFGLGEGEAHILRNAGARVTDDVVRSLIVSTVAMGVSRIAVVHHTNCGAHELSPHAMSDQVLAGTGQDPAGVDFHFYSDQVKAVRDDVDRLVRCPYLPASTFVAGFVYDVDTGELRQLTPVETVRP